ncbi:putative lipase [Mycobacterium sp. PSTR-4-N]|uniref:esterase/lipase family protein n=1 Tax=Mycobacterium sp. PSTR-4-N TaxID=2917745 RepID=UPI001F152FE8|nr:putative lipase [Mycobacterium sp. PSTR-4-N]MCG7597278.1 putative lipase [Mycobacterium sp. PSTR-4-N]
MNLHRNPGRPGQTLAIFVHGFDGDGYGTWLDFPKYIFNGTPDGTAIDVAIFRYDTGHIAALKRKVNLPVAAERLAESIRELSATYSSIYFVCHSLGGLLAHVAIENYLNQHTYNHKTFSTIIGGMFLLGSPRAGNWMALPLLTWFYREFKWLARFSERITSTEKFFTNNVESEAVADPGRKPFLIPRFVCMGNADAVAEEFSVTYGMPADRIYYPDLDHGQLPKPTSATSLQVTWLCREKRRIDQLRAQWFRGRAHAATHSAEKSKRRALFFAELWTDTSGFEYRTIYDQARHEVALEHSSDRTEVAIHDKGQLAEDAAGIDLLISVHSTQRVLATPESEHKIVLEAQRRHQQENSLTVAMAPVGRDCAQACTKMEAWLAPNRPYRRFYIEGASGSVQLKLLMRKWLDSILTESMNFANFQETSLGDILQPPSPYRRLADIEEYR